LETPSVAKNGIWKWSGREGDNRPPTTDKRIVRENKFDFREAKWMKIPAPAYSMTSVSSGRYADQGKHVQRKHCIIAAAVYKRAAEFALT